VVSFGYTRVTMISITRHEVPEYLRTGELYASLSLEDGEPFQVPSSATKRDPEVLNLENLRHLLESLRYWVIKDPLEVVIKYVLSDTLQSVEVGVLGTEFEIALPYVRVLSRIT
jgi:hypothetical protein